MPRRQLRFHAFRFSLRWIAAADVYQRLSPMLRVAATLITLMPAFLFILRLI